MNEKSLWICIWFCLEFRVALLDELRSFFNHCLIVCHRSFCWDFPVRPPLEMGVVQRMYQLTFFVFYLEIACDVELLLICLLLLIDDRVVVQNDLVQRLSSTVWKVLAGVWIAVTEGRSSVSYFVTQCYNLLDVILEDHLPKAFNAVILRSLGGNDKGERITLRMALAKR
jgi:hypothetical protein